MEKNKEAGFTLIEMLIVLFIISVLVVITVPNVTKHFASVDEKGCEAFVKMVQGQVEAYKIDHQKVPSINLLVEKQYLNEGETTCPNGTEIEIKADGLVGLKE